MFAAMSIIGDAIGLGIVTDGSIEAFMFRPDSPTPLVTATSLLSGSTTSKSFFLAAMESASTLEIALLSCAPDFSGSVAEGIPEFRSSAFWDNFATAASAA